MTSSVCTRTTSHPLPITKLPSHTYGCEQAPIDDSRHAHMTYQR